MKEMKDSLITRKLVDLLQEDEELKGLLRKSIEKARQINQNEDSNPVYNLEDYLSFVKRCCRCLPWRFYPGDRYSSLYDRIDQSMGIMYFYVDQPLEELEDRGYYYPSLIYHEPFKSWFSSYLKEIGRFLDSEQSWNEEAYQIALGAEEYGLQGDLYEDPKNWKTFNQFFSRKLKDPSKRPIDHKEDPFIVVSPADAIPMGIWKIDENGNIEDKNDLCQNGIVIKTGTLTNVKTFLSSSSYRDCFNEGVLSHTFLDNHDYHRYHFPFSGRILEILKIEGVTAPGGVITWDEKNQRYKEYFSEVFGWQSIETRILIIMEVENHGLAAVCPIGMCQVASVNLEKEIAVGKYVEKGDPLGYFLYGGSDIVMLFSKKAGFTMTCKENVHLNMGQEYGRLK